MKAFPSGFFRPFCLKLDLLILRVGKSVGDGEREVDLQKNERGPPWGLFGG